MSAHSPVLTLSKTAYPAIIFDLDGVITQTADVHAAAWKAMFDEFLKRYANEHNEPYKPFDLDKDYRRYVDGKPRYEGVKGFLQSRGIDLPYGDPQDSPDQETVCGLGNRKNQLFQKKVKDEGVEVFESSIELLRNLRNQGFKTAVVTSSKNCTTILEAAGIADLFDAQVDGVVAAELGLEGKPNPDIFVEAARRLQVEPTQAVVFEDAIAGVQAGRRGGFGCVVGVDRIGQPEALQENGADVVVDDLAKIGIEPKSGNDQGTGALPSALDRFSDIAEKFQGKCLALFLDYDGTLTPIVDHPEQAVLSESMREAIRELARYCTVAVVSGRDLGGVRKLVGLDEIFYAGSHGFDIAGPKGKHIEYQQGADFLPTLDQAEQELWEKLDEVPGCLVERKKFAIAVHYRQVAEEHTQTVTDVVEQVVRSHPELRKTGGKKIYELRPNIDWDKGKAVGWLLEVLELDRTDVLPLYIGDDETDEDAFRALRERGIGIRVEDEPKPSQAHYTLRDTDQVRRFFGALLDILKNP